MTVPVFSDRHRVAVPCACILGEGPVWDDRSGVLYWVDIAGCALWSWRPGSGEEAISRPVGERVGFVVLTTDPDLLILGLKSGVARWRLSDGTCERVLAPEPDRPGNRLNDGTVGPDGSIYFGSMDDSEREPTGSFYRWSETGLARFGGHATVTNGPAIDPASRILYVTDTSNRVVYRHRLEPDGTPDAGEPFVTFRESDGHPDGSTVDSENHVWICHFGGGRVTRFSPAGEPVLIVPIPTGQVTKVAFGGPHLSTLYVTTAARDRDRSTDPMAGHVLSFDVGIRGLPADRCRMGVA